ncbi:MAG: YbfB/YjiJ family MFS transporter [Ilumatobacter sp.]|uniref:MFS transporter n=1 Tax=Ilumatobacter sp. TaxID=1967498 RepID=UPI002627E3C5|nr:MFS transporter [Ilumatobacter sp.]MDJ0769968.1 YbfB/YjiJ family MFS transporter [Ilumatobacter sp.]
MTVGGADVALRERAWLVVVLVMASACVAQAFGRFTWGVVLPGARDDLLDGSNTIAGLFGTLNVSAYLVGTLAVSWLASRLTLVGLVRMGLVISTSALGVAAIAPSGPVLGLALAAMGLGGAVIWIPAPAISARALPPARAGMAVGLIGSGIGIGILFAGQMSAYLERRSDRDDLWQTLYRIEFAIAVVVLVGAFVALRSHGDRPGAAGGFGGVGALRTVKGWIPVTVAYAAFGFAYILVIGFLVARLEDDSGFSSGEAATMFSIMGASTVVGGLSLGPLSDRFGRRVTLTTTFVLFGLCGLLVLTGRQPWVAVASVGVGLMFSGMPALIIAHVVDHTDVDTYGPAFSAATLAFGVTQMISPQIGGAMADALDSFTWVFVLSAVVSFIGAAFASRLP